MPPKTVSAPPFETSGLESGLHAGSSSGFDGLRLPGLGRFLRWRHSRTAMQLPLLVLALAMIVHGLLGPQLAPKNLATVLTWVHYRGVLVAALLLAGNLLCMACPLMLVRDVARRLVEPRRHWPRRLRSKWLAAGLFVLVLFAYELFDLWGSPWWTAWLIVAYFVGAVVVDTTFRHASFCKWVCPVGQFNFVASTVSPLEVKVREPEVCAACETLDCIKGTRDPERPDVVLQRGCELALAQPRKTGNMDCTFCLDCVYACPHDNVGLTARVPGSELWTDPRRSGVGRFSRRRDLGALAVLFTFGALLNTFGMVSPVYAVQSWLAGAMGIRQEAPVLGVLFGLALVVEPILLLGLAGALSRRGAAVRSGARTGARAEARAPLVPWVNRFVYALIPLGFGIWLGHYGFHLLTGLWTFVPVTQGAFAAAGLPWLGAPDWTFSGLPADLVYPLQIGLVSLGLLGSLLVAWRIAEREVAAGDPGDDREHDPGRALRAFVPWAGLFVLLWAVALWLLSQPMEMRGTFLGS